MDALRVECTAAVGTVTSCLTITSYFIHVDCTENIHVVKIKINIRDQSIFKNVFMLLNVTHGFEDAVPKVKLKAILAIVKNSQFYNEKAFDVFVIFVDAF